MDSHDLAEWYGTVADTYRDCWAPILRIPGRKLLEQLAAVPCERILDVGTGVGSLIPELAKTFPTAFVIGVDRSPGMLKLAPPGMARATMDASRLGIAPASIDLALLVFVLIHIEEPLEAFKESRRILRDGGRLGVLTWESPIESMQLEIWKECLDEHGATGDAAGTSEVKAVDSPEEMKALLDASGFSSVRCWSEELQVRIGGEEFIRLMTTVNAGPRWKSLSPVTGEACMAQARRRLSRLRPGESLARGSVVYAVASA